MDTRPAGEKLVNRRAYFEQLLYKTVATVAISGASSLVAPPRRSFAAGYEEPGSRWQPEVGKIKIVKMLIFQGEDEVDVRGESRSRTHAIQSSF